MILPFYKRLIAREDFYQTWERNRCTLQKGLTDDVLQKHIAGDLICVVYAADELNRCKALVLDIDNHEGLNDRTEFAKALWEKYPHALLEESSWVPPEFLRVAGIILKLDEPPNSLSSYKLWFPFNDWCDRQAAYDFGTSICPNGECWMIPGNRPVNTPTGGSGYFGMAYRLPGPTSPRQGSRSRVWNGSDWLTFGTPEFDAHCNSIVGIDPIKKPKPVVLKAQSKMAMPRAPVAVAKQQREVARKNAETALVEWKRTEGPKLWAALHRAALDLPLDAFKAHVDNLVKKKIPCGECKKHTAQYLTQNPILETDPFGWSVDFHNSANVRNGKPVWTREAALELYAAV